MKRILAWIGIILLVLLYLTTLIASLINSPFSRSLFYASVAMTIILPVLLYGYHLIYRVLRDRYSPAQTDLKQPEPDKTADDLSKNTPDETKPENK